MIRLNGLTGGLLGSAVVALGFVGSVVVAPPVSRDISGIPASSSPEALPADPAPQTAPPPDAPAPEPEPTEVETTEQADAPEPEADAPVPEPEFAMDPAPSTAPLALPDPVQDPVPEMPEQAPTVDPAPADLPAELMMPQDTTPPSPSPAPQMADTEAPASDNAAALTDTSPPSMPDPDLRAATRGLPDAPVPPRDQPLPPPPSAPDAAQAAPEDSAADLPGLPGTRITGMPGQPAAEPAPDPQPEDPPAPATALERNSSFSGTFDDGPLMAVVLNDPGLPTPLRRALAALELPVTIALNPMDPSAAEAADLYREAGKEVLILANGLPDGAQATDLDITFGAWFDSLPQAVGVLDLPRGGFSRNTNLTDQVLPLVARDGHGLVSFAGGLSRVDSAADREGVPHAQVFRVLDDEDQSPFTIRRYLDRAVFQASQIGEVIVFGDAANDATMEALEMWRSDGRADQVAVVPISAILLTR
ncbi:divergent polysaccharide deacetylase family protein [Roseibaca calidilacus]|uniref:Divergent polysaccharide deacetylase n=2 Tax=Roseibaca calidilacus TaxID=1666912 RepID=A0ABP2BR93_9RHOB|nr:divergent polysaccharide deacetylase family protein [Roseibaca calidilacus]CUX79700.1 hypothetical protein Ga0058931_0387 [Roseibaca calidilacus]